MFPSGKRQKRSRASFPKNFDMDCYERMLQKPLGQIWRNHLLAGSQLIVDGFDDASSVLLFPVENEACWQAAEMYSSCLTDGRTFMAWTMERLVEVIRKVQPSAWIESFALRYSRNQAAVNGRDCSCYYAPGTPQLAFDPIRNPKFHIKPVASDIRQTRPAYASRRRRRLRDRSWRGCR